ncbi:MAG: phosphate ABC transporter permease PstA [Candidatus Bathyarchaeia archaeon]
MRKLLDNFMKALVWLALVVALIPLFIIIIEIFSKGASNINIDILISPMPTVGERGGGIANAIQGTLITICLASILGVPLGVLSGIFLSEYGDVKISSTVRLFNDVLSGFPSIVIGIFSYTLIVTYIGFSVMAAAFALAIIMIPIVTRTTEEALKIVPLTVREAALALGISRWRTLVYIVIRGAKRGIVTGILLAIARVAGESAPVLITMGYWRWWFSGLNRPVANLALNIYLFAVSPFENWRNLAWASALVLTAIILFINLGLRIFTKEKYI